MFICSADEAARKVARSLVFGLQDMGIFAQYDLNERSLKAQLKFANKTGAKYSLVLGETELSSGKGTLKDMRGASSFDVDIDAAQLAAALSK